VVDQLCGAINAALRALALFHIAAPSRADMGVVELPVLPPLRLLCGATR
jgi:hypothetical protein